MYVARMGEIFGFDVKTQGGTRWGHRKFLAADVVSIKW
jgi:hypothetical protein